MECLKKAITIISKYYRTKKETDPDFELSKVIQNTLEDLAAQTATAKTPDAKQAALKDFITDAMAAFENIPAANGKTLEKFALREYRDNTAEQYTDQDPSKAVSLIKALFSQNSVINLPISVQKQLDLFQRKTGIIIW